MPSEILAAAPAAAPENLRGSLPTSREARTRPWLASVIVAWLLRVGVMLATKAYLFPPLRPTSDPLIETWYFGFEVGRIASSIAAGHGFSSPFHSATGPSAWLAPVYPYLLAGIFRGFGIYTHASGIAILTLNSTFAALTCIPIFLIADHLLGRRLAVWAAWLWAVVPLFFAIPVSWAWETSFSTLLLMTALLLTMRLEPRNAWNLWLGWGLLWGVIALTNPSLLSIMPGAALWAGWRMRRREFALRAALAIAVTCLTITPWLVRNHQVFGRWIFIRSNFGAELRFGNGEQARGIWLGWMHPSINHVEQQRYERMGELAYVEYKKQEALEFIRWRPEFFAELTVRRVFMFWCDVPANLSEDLSARDVLVGQWPAICFSALALLGWGLMLARRPRPAWFFAPGLLLYPCLYYITYPHPRYRHPIEPLMLILAVFAVSECKELKSRS
jgi:4-amino-4-deoxy-L-arabinose transferase-like glycosyltransferase